MSDDRVSIVLYSWPQAWQAFKDTSAWAKALLLAGHRLVLELRRETRTDAQNRLLHSRLGDVAKHCEWAGSKRDVDTWRRLFMSSWLRIQGEQIELLPALDGHGVDIVYASTRKLSRRECADLSEYVMAWGSEREVPWRPASLGRDGQEPTREHTDPETGEITEVSA